MRMYFIKGINMNKIVRIIRVVRKAWFSSTLRAMATCVAPPYRKSAFTLAEMMVVMLIVSLIMAAFLPIMTKRGNNAMTPTTWNFAANNSDIFYGVGATQGAVIGAGAFPAAQSARLFLNMPTGYNATPATTTSGQLMFGVNGASVARIQADATRLNIITPNGNVNSFFINGIGLSTMFMAAPSDRRLKNVNGPSVAGLKEIKQIKTYNYTFKDDKEKTPRVGVMAQDLQKIFPKAVSKNKDGYLQIRQEDMFYTMINSIQELDKKVTNLETENRTLKARLSKIEAED